MQDPPVATATPSPQPRSPPRAVRASRRAARAAGKRDAEDQTPVHTTPSRTHAQSKPRVGRLRDIRVEGLIRTPPKSATDDELQNGACGGHYTIYLENCSKQRIIVRVSKEAFTSGDPAGFMMGKVRGKLREDAEDLSLDLGVGNCKTLMGEQWPWDLFWQSYQKEVSDVRISRMKASSASKKGAATKKDRRDAKDWVAGSPFQSKAAKSHAKSQILEALEAVCDKQLLRAQSTLSSVAFDLACSGLEYETIIPPDLRKRIKMLGGMVSNARAAINGLKNNPTKQSIHALTGFCAIMAIPPEGEGDEPDDDDDDSTLSADDSADEEGAAFDGEGNEDSGDDVVSQFSTRAFSQMFGVNRDAKYLANGVQNRRAFNRYLELEGDIAVGEKVSCRGGSDATLIGRDADGAVTIQLHPYETVKRYTSATSAQMMRQQPSLISNDRGTRSDTTPSVDKELFDSFFRRQCALSPHKKDTVKQRHPDFRTQFLEKRRLIHYETLDEMWGEFKRQHPDLYERYGNEERPNTAPKIFYDCRPFEMTKGGNVSCLCVVCEGFSCLMRGAPAAIKLLDRVLERLSGSRRDNSHVASRLSRLKKILETPSKYGVITECLRPCLEGDDGLECLECAQVPCIRNLCGKCGFSKLWSGDLRVLASAPVTGRGNARSSSVAGPEWTNDKVHWMRYCKEATPAPASVAASNASTNIDDEAYSPNAAAGNRNLIQSATSGTLIEWLDEIEDTIARNGEHRNILSCANSAQLSYDRNSRPRAVRRNIDYAENGTIKGARQVQQQYWGTVSYTLLMSVVSWLRTKEWDKVSGALAIGAEVTVNGEKAGEPVNVDSFWAQVTRVVDAEQDRYEVTDAEGVKTEQRRCDLRHRVRHQIVFGHVSDDKSHDTAATIHYTLEELPWLEAHMSAHFPEDIPGGKLTRLHMESDNATQHFKNTEEMAFYSRMAEERGGSTECAFVYSFGPPHHGKGPWDGFGGTLKRKVDQVCKSALASPEGLPYTDTRFVQDSRDVYDVLCYHFEDPEHRERRKDRNSVNEWHFFHHATADSPVQRSDEKWAAMDDITKHYQMVMRSEGVIYQRLRLCWCLPCIASMWDGFNGWADDTHVVPDCLMSSAEEDDSDESDEESEEEAEEEEASATPLTKAQKFWIGKKYFTFYRGKAVKENGKVSVWSGAIPQPQLKEVAMKLEPGMWVLYDSKERDQPMWLGRTMSNPEWNGKSAWFNDTRRHSKFDLVKISCGQVGLYIIWYEKMDVNSTVCRKYQVSTNLKPLVQPIFPLMLCDFEMVQTMGQKNPVPKLRGQRRRANDDDDDSDSDSSESESELQRYRNSRRSYKMTNDTWLANEQEVVWTMPKDVIERGKAEVGRRVNVTYD